ncbi:MAG: DUF2232 domain-containing protein [Magnetococcales bacterium]|nr:DUF2232 domain-containing protein [Magnetococcales bacterium]
MLIRIVSEYPAIAGLGAMLLLMLPTLVAVFLSSSQGSGLAMMLALPFQAITPLPIFLVSLKRGLKGGLIATAILTGGTLLLTQDFQFSLLVFLLLAAFPLLASVMLIKGWNFSHGAGSGFFLGLLLLPILLTVSIHAPLEIEKTLTSSLTTVQDRFVSMAQSQGADAKTILEHQQVLKEFFHLLAFLSPALMVTGWFMLQLANLALTRFLFSKMPGYTLPRENFANFRVPFFMVWPVIVFALIMMTTEGQWQRFSANMSLFLGIPYFFQGWAVIQSYFLHLKVPAFWRNLFYFFIFWSSKMALVVVVFGFFDTWVNFRSRIKKTGEGQDPSGR